MMSAVHTAEKLAFWPKPRLKIPMTVTVPKALQQENAQSIDGNALLCRVGKDRDRAAFVELFRYYAPRVKSYLLKHGASDSQAEEVVQNTFVTIWEKSSSYDPRKSAASTWIFTVARNKRIDTMRREKFVEVNSDDPALLQAVAAETEDYADSATIERLSAAIETLPREQAELVRMAFFEDKSHGAIAQETNIPLGTVKSRLRLALDKLKYLMKGEPRP